MTDWLFDYMDRAECHAHLRVVKLVIELEKQIDEPYTKDPAIMAQLRAANARHEKRIKEINDD
jgi:hypothetical protein